VHSSFAEVLWTARFDYQPQSKLARHRHAHFQMIYCLGGSGRFLLKDREYPLGEGTLFLIKPRCEHGLEPTSLVKTLDLKFLVKDRRLRRSLLGASEFIDEQDPRVAALFEQIRTEGERKDPLYREMCGVLLIQLLIRYLRRDRPPASADAAPLVRPEGPPRDGVALRAIEFIEKNYAGELSLRDIAAAVGRSDRRLRDRFEECFGAPPMRYLAQYRVRRAKDLIQYSDHALKDVAGMVGFKSIHHFTRVFHEIAGETPGAWRRKYQAGICKDVVIDPRFSNTNRVVSGAGSEEDLHR
jgi:AraC-like DNA-binding protein